MRIIAWNTNHNDHTKRSFQEAAEYVYDEGADLAILSEVARPEKTVGGQIDWIGTRNPGLAVVARNGYKIRPSALNAHAPDLFGAYHVSGPCSFNLVAAWPVQYPKRSRYHQLLKTALTVFGNFLSAERSVLVGDLNSTTKVTAQAKSHPAFVKQARGLRLESIFHHQEKVEHGREEQPTYRHSGRGKGRFHIDYCFLSPALLGSAEIRILNEKIWEKRSDHFPIVVDLAVG